MKKQKTEIVQITNHTEQEKKKKEKKKNDCPSKNQSTSSGCKALKTVYSVSISQWPTSRLKVFQEVRFTAVPPMTTRLLAQKENKQKNSKSPLTPMLKIAMLEQT